MNASHKNRKEVENVHNLLSLDDGQLCVSSHSTIVVI